ncbi:MAG: type IV pilin [Halobellus sp.]|uniref:type IV pilin n=1 Tax=Halobellus sp. TaxID=1979212 RepID=UPI0035D44891
MTSPSSRAVSSTIATVLLVAIVVTLAATISVFGFGNVEDLRSPAPVVGESSGELVPQDGNSGGIVRITHLGGDTLQASNLEIVVDAEEACGKTGRLVNLPASGGDPRPEDEYEGGDYVFDNSYNSVSGPIGETGGRWDAGETSSFRIAVSECGLDQGETIVVRVVHTPSNSVVIDETLTVE